jgi:hypothetical protein
MLQEQEEYPSAKYGTFPILEKENSKNLPHTSKLEKNQLG